MACWGGDEINWIREGKHYGFPYRAYGIPYGGARAWAPNRRYDKSAYEEPLLAFGESQGISDITQVRLDGVDGWENVLLVATLNKRNLYRLVVEQGRVVVIEPIVTGIRVRAIEFHDNTVYMVTDESGGSRVYRFDIDYRYDEFE
ncbi:MAG: PQQ-dependent sugar dehydrogenase [Alphaproteobacteria bacterium GM202ARS2]|nr:PQQ-dependent sugar dehydrogenase [Alphaproteobacteria bacterium GM202ARS2]